MNEAQHRALTERMDRIIALLERILAGQEKPPTIVYTANPDVAEQQAERIAHAMRRGVTAPSKPPRKAKAG